MHDLDKAIRAAMMTAHRYARQHFAEGGFLQGLRDYFTSDGKDYQSSNDLSADFLARGYGAPLVQGDRINWGDPDNKADFVRADKADAAMMAAKRALAEERPADQPAWTAGMARGTVEARELPPPGQKADLQAAPTVLGVSEGAAYPVIGTFVGGPKSHYGANRSGGSRQHAGVDWQAENGSHVFAPDNGRVVYVGNHSGYGNVIDVLDEDGNVRRFAVHEGNVNVKPGDALSKGQRIGTIGGGHLHHEIIRGGTPAADAAINGQFGQTSRVGGRSEYTMDPAAFYGLQPGTRVFGPRGLGKAEGGLVDDALRVVRERHADGEAVGSETNALGMTPDQFAEYLKTPAPPPDTEPPTGISRVGEGFRAGFGPQPFGFSEQNKAHYPLTTGTWNWLAAPVDAALRLPGAVIGATAGAAAARQEAKGATRGEANRLQRDLNTLGIVAAIEAGNVRPMAPRNVDAIPRGGEILPPGARSSRAIEGPPRPSPGTIDQYGRPVTPEVPLLEAPAAVVPEAPRQIGYTPPVVDPVVAAVRRAKEVIAAPAYERQRSPLGFYSHGAETAANLAQAKGAPDQMIAMLRKDGVKPDELYNAGIADETATNAMRSKIEREYAPKLAAAKLEMDALGLNENTTNKKSPDYNKALEIRQSPETKAKYQYDSALNAMRSDMDSAMVLQPEWSSRPSVTREELAKHFNERRPQVEETVLGFNPRTHELYTARGAVRSELKGLPESDPKYAELWNKHDAFTREIESIGDTPTKFSEYTLPGGENYREVLLKMPVQVPPSYSIVQKGEGKWSLVNEKGFPLASRGSEEELRQAIANNPGWFPKFASQHWPQDPNVLAHLRMADRTGPNGEKILHVEEFQSDWGQQGKKAGFNTPETTKQIESINQKITDLMGQRDSLKDQLKDLQPKSGGYGEPLEYPEHYTADLEMGIRKKIKNIENEVRDLRESRPSPGLPTAPYVTNTQAWTDLALKRALREAAEGGYDKLVWTPGAEQAKRYDLSKQISRLVLENDPAGGHKLRAYSPSGDQVINKRIVDADRELPDLIGKDVAKKLLDQDLVNPKVFNEKLTSNDIIVVPKEGRYQISAPWGWSTHVGMGVVNSPEAAAEYGARHFSNLAKEANSNMGTSHATEYKNATRSLVGQDLSVGGEGMKGYYDKIFPNQLSKLVKKLDPSAKVGITDVMLPQGKHGMMGHNNPPFAAPGVDITPKMREAIMKGQTDFARGGSIPFGPDAAQRAVQIAKQQAGRR